MEIIGDDKKLRALYSEARVADESVTPSFTSVWHRAQARSLKPRRAFNFSFALVAALLVLTLGSLAVWSLYPSRNHQRQAVKNKTPDVTPAPANDVKTAQERPAPIERPANRPVKSRVKRSTASATPQLTAKNQTTLKEKSIDAWQSPTAALLTSPSDELFKSMPQLNENANALKSSLPGRNDKEK